MVLERVENGGEIRTQRSEESSSLRALGDDDPAFRRMTTPRCD
jgi:hypothetical protein